MPEKILEVNAAKKSYIITILIELSKRDEKSYGLFLNRTYYLLRRYLLTFRDAGYNIELLKQLLDSRLISFTKSTEDISQSYKKLRTNFVMMNIILAFLYHPLAETEVKKIGKKVLEYIYA